MMLFCKPRTADETVKEKTVQMAENGKAKLDEKLHGKG